MNFFICNLKKIKDKLDFFYFDFYVLKDSFKYFIYKLGVLDDFDLMLSSINIYLKV